MRWLVIAATAGIVVTALASTAAAPSTDEDALLHAAVDRYLSFVAVPDPHPIDPLLFASDIEAFWSNGLTYRGRDAVVQAIESGVREVATDFQSMQAKVEGVTLHRKGHLAWLACRIHFDGTLKEDNSPFSRTIRSTFVFEKRGGRWQMVHEHSSRLPAKGK